RIPFNPETRLQRGDKQLALTIVAAFEVAKQPDHVTAQPLTLDCLDRKRSGQGATQGRTHQKQPPLAGGLAVSLVLHPEQIRLDALRGLLAVADVEYFLRDEGEAQIAPSGPGRQLDDGPRRNLVA